MTQSRSDLDFLNSLHLMIDSIESSYLEKADDDLPDRFSDSPDAIKRVSHNGDEEHLPEDERPLDTSIVGGGDIKHQRNIQNAGENDLPDADHWCPDVMDWHTSEHKPAKAPSVPINVGQDNGNDSAQSENTDIEKVGVLAGVVRAAAPTIGQAVGEKIGSKIKGNAVEKDWDETESVMGAWGDAGEVEKGEYDQNTNLEREEQENSEHSIAEPFLNRYAISEEEEEEEDKDLETSFDKSIDILKIWGSVDRVIPKTDNIDVVDDINILKSFNLDKTTNVEELVEGTLVHKMLIDRSSRPTSDWWYSSMLLAKSIDAVSEPAFFSAFLYYEPDTFDITNFIEIEKAELIQGKPQDLEMMPNSSGGSAIDGLGMSADDLERNNGPKDDECED